MSADTIYAILVGLAIGLLLGLLKVWLLWFRNNPFEPKEPGKELGVHGILARSMISYFLNIIILGLIFLFRSLLPWPLTPLILTAAAGLILCGLLYPVQNMLRK